MKPENRAAWSPRIAPGDLPWRYDSLSQARQDTPARPAIVTPQEVLHYVLDAADLIVVDGRPWLLVAASVPLLDYLAGIGAELEDLEETPDHEPDCDAEPDSDFEPEGYPL